MRYFFTDSSEILTIGFKKAAPLPDYSHCHIGRRNFPHGVFLPLGNYDYSVITGNDYDRPIELCNNKMQGSFCNTQFMYCIGNGLMFENCKLIDTCFKKCAIDFDKQHKVQCECIHAYNSEFYLEEFKSLSVFKSEFSFCDIDFACKDYKIGNDFSLVDSVFTDCSFEHLNFCNSGSQNNLILRCYFRNCDFLLCDLANVEIEDCVFKDCDFRACSNYTLDALRQQNEVKGCKETG